MFDRLQKEFIENKEVALYIIFGGLTTVVSIATYGICDMVLGYNPLIANVISWIFAVTFAYVTNQKWVFDSKASGWKAILIEMIKFYVGRLATLGMEEAILWAGVILMHLPGMGVKLFAQIAVLVGNYVISKFFVFQ